MNPPLNFDSNLLQIVQCSLEQCNDPFGCHNIANGMRHPRREWGVGRRSEGNQSGGVPGPEGGLWCHVWDWMKGAEALYVAAVVYHSLGLSIT